MNIEKQNKSYNDVINDIKQDIKKTQFDIMINANISLVHLYYRIGKVLYDNSKGGNKFIDKLSFELKEEYPNQKGFSIRNLKYMKTFYKEYKDDSEFVHLGAQLPWKHNVSLIEKVKNKKIRKWYMKKCIEDGWSKSVMIFQIDTNLYKRVVSSDKHNNFNLTLSKNSDLADNMIKEPYVFDLVGLSKKYNERELENKMIERLKNVLLEFGNGFSYVGNQYKITVDNQDFYIDLLFYHIKLKCFIAVELKIGDFIPEYAGKMGFYLSVLDCEIKDKNDNSSIGIILCQNKSNKIVDYTLNFINKPVGVSEYKIFDKSSNDILKELKFEDDSNSYIKINED